MRPDELGRILSSEETIVPSPDFAGRVMAAVWREAMTPPPIPFPWKRALPGILVSIGALALIAVAVVPAIARELSAGGSVEVPWMSALVPALAVLGAPETRWVALALLISLASVRLSRHAVLRRSR